MKHGFYHLIIFCVLALQPGLLFGQRINGKVIDGETGEPLPGVAIQYNQSQNLGTTTNLDGKFYIPNQSLVQQVIFSFIGYQTLIFSAEDIPMDKIWLVQLKPESQTLNEIEVIAGENPALRMVRQAIAKRNENNPRKYSSYTYLSYNKDVITYKMELPDSILSRKDSLQFMRDTSLAKSRHLLVIESVTRKYYKTPNKAKEIVIGSKISGFQHPSVATIPDGIQNFGFHENIIPLVNKKFLNPLADGADKRYHYILKDTLFLGKDSVFIMDYFPEKGSNFEGFVGELHISTRNWALVHVTAAPFDEGKVNISLEQDYQLINGKHWFPSRLSYELELEKMPFRQAGAVMQGTTFLDSVQIGLDIPDERFDLIAVDVNKRAGFVGDDFWQTYRRESLSTKEMETYRQMDSIGRRYRFDALLNATRHAYEGFIAVGKLDIEVSKLAAYNDYEGLRLGMGLYTNDAVSEKFMVGGYVGHGSLDQRWKYGGTLRWYFNKKNDFYITATHLNDVRDPGGIRIKYKEWGNVSQQFFNKLMDRVEETELSVTFRTGTYAKFKVSARQFTLTPTYDYVFNPNPAIDPIPRGYAFTEAQLWYRWQYKEKFSKNMGQRVSHGSKWPIVNVIYSRGISEILGSDFAYNKVEAGVFLERFTKNLGKTRIALEAGWVDVPLPWSMNFSGRPSFNPTFSVVVKETFQTMRFNEFSADQYFSVFFMHDFGPLLLRYEHFKPEVRIAQAFSMGSLRHAEYHIGVPFKTLEDGFLESGLIVDNLLRINMFNTGYFGIGAGVFYRYGANHLPVEIDNWTFKLAFMYSVN